MRYIVFVAIIALLFSVTAAHAYTPPTDLSSYSINFQCELTGGTYHSCDEFVNRSMSGGYCSQTGSFGQYRLDPLYPEGTGVFDFFTTDGITLNNNTTVQWSNIGYTAATVYYYNATYEEYETCTYSCSYNPRDDLPVFGCTTCGEGSYNSGLPEGENFGYGCLTCEDAELMEYPLEECAEGDLECFVPEYNPQTDWDDVTSAVEDSPLYQSIGNFFNAFSLPPYLGDKTTLVFDVLTCDSEHPNSWACKFGDIQIDMEKSYGGISPLDVSRAVIAFTFGFFVLSLFYRR